MRRAMATVGAVVLVALALAVVPAQPAAALVTVTTSGSTMTATVTGAETVRISCTGGNATINGQTGSPAVACSALTKVTVNADSAAQTVRGDDLEQSAFSANPFLVANTGDGGDQLYETTRSDAIDLAGGDDRLYMVRGAVNSSTALGVGTDTAVFFGNDFPETLVASSTTSVATFTHSYGGTPVNWTVSGVEKIEISGRGGDDQLDASGVTAASTIDDVSLFGGLGNDVLRGAQATNTLFAGPGTNQIFGGPLADNIGSEGEGDTINEGGGTNDWVFDRNSLRSGGRMLSGNGSGIRHTTEIVTGDAVTRIRPDSSGGALLTTSLTRTGQQLLPAPYSTIQAYHGYNGGADARTLFDVVALSGNRTVYLDGDNFDNGLADITIPTGSWTTSGSAASGLTIDPTAGGLGTITVTDTGDVRIHGPWTNKNAGFAHRVTRDLMFRFATNVADIAIGLGDGEITRPGVVELLMDSDEYRGLDVDRTFVKYLGRSADPGGRTYWINSIRSGKALWRFRAQLFGSNEYFTKSGGNNEAYLVEVYNDVLGRDPDPSGRTYWTNKLNAGADRGSVALQFINGSEFRRYLIDEQFLRFLDRKATTGEQGFWSQVLKTSATGEQQLIAFLAASDAYYQRS